MHSFRISEEASGKVNTQADLEASLKVGIEGQRSFPLEEFCPPLRPFDSDDGCGGGLDTEPSYGVWGPDSGCKH